MPRVDSRAGARNAAIYYVPEGYSTSGPHFMGINAASEGLLKAMAQHAAVDCLYAYAESAESGREFDRVVQGFRPGLRTEWIPTERAERLEAVGALMLPGPGLSAYAWMRRQAGAKRYSLVGVTHSTASPVAMDDIAEFWTAPVEPWDALICTSIAMRSMVSRLLDDQKAYLAERFGQVTLAGPQLPVIPLGIDCAAFAPDAAARADWRARLGLADDEIALLYMGRLSPWSKSHPMPLFLAVEMAARRSGATLRLVLAGWFAQDGLEALYAESAAMLCPSVQVTFVDGRGPARWKVWQAADIFVAPLDNFQESFGLAPLEAMAAALPVVSSDWDGVRDTVRHGEDGLLASTTMAPAGAGADIARSLGARMLGIDQFQGQTSQSIAVDVEALAEAIGTLAGGPQLRARMGAAGRARALADYDWRVIIGRYGELWRDLEQRRPRAARRRVKEPPWPARGDPFRAFASHPTRQLSGEMTVRAGPVSAAALELIYHSPLVGYAHGGLPDLAEMQRMMSRVEQGPLSLRTLVETADSANAAPRWRAVAWLLKYSLVRVS